MPISPYKLQLPSQRTTAVVFASPHSGRDYPWAFLQQSILDERTIRSSEDAFVDVLFDAAPSMGAPFIAAQAPRAYIDLNRSAEELDPALIRDVRKLAHNPRVASGLGVIPRVVSNGRAIYSGKLPLTEAQYRLDTYWRPYHAQIQTLLDQTRAEMGQAVLIDCHSMPHEAIEAAVASREPRPEIVLGDRFGAAAAPEIVERVEAAFAAEGLRVTRNAPFAGAYTAQHYGRPSRHQHVVQVEIDRALYMNERLVRPSADFRSFKALINRVISDLTEIGRNDVRLAAE